MEEKRAYDAAVETAKTLLGTEVSAEVPLMSAGMDSIAATEFTRILSDAVGMGLPSTLLFDHPTIKGISHFVNSLMNLEGDYDHVVEVLPVQSTSVARNSVESAVLQDSKMLAWLSSENCVLPGKVTKDRAVCELVAGRFVAASCSPISRWEHPVAEHDVFSPAQTYGAFALRHLTSDSSVFGISSLESRTMDPQMAFTLEICSGAF